MPTCRRRSIARARRGDKIFALHLIDLDGFKAVNDVYGHSVGDRSLQAIGARLREGSKSLADSMRWILATGGQDLNAVLAGAVPFLHLCGVVCGGWQMARAALAAQRKLAADSGDADFYRAKIATARFFADQDLSRARGLAEATMHAGASTMALGEDQF